MLSVEIYDISITYNIKITLPTLIDDTALNPAEKNLWKNYYHRLVEYEHDHARIIRDKDAQEELRKKFSESGLCDLRLFKLTSTSTRPWKRSSRKRRKRSAVNG